MKKYILLFTFVFCGFAIFSSCTKHYEPKNVTLNETVQSGATFSLDMSAYTGRHSTCAIGTQATNFTISQVDKDAVTGRDIYHFSSDSKTDEKETVVINVTDKDNGPCNQDDSKTAITINFTISK